MQMEYAFIHWFDGHDLHPHRSTKAPYAGLRQQRERLVVAHLSGFMPGDSCQ